MGIQIELVAINSQKDFADAVDKSQLTHKRMFCTQCGVHLVEENFGYIHDLGCCPFCRANVVSVLLG